MKTLNSGIFIPSMAVNRDAYASFFPKFLNTLDYDRDKLAQGLTRADVQGKICFAVQVTCNTDNCPYLGLFLKLEKPCQLEYQRALRVIKEVKLRLIDEYTVPLNNVLSAGLGVVTKSVVAKFESNQTTVEVFQSKTELLLELLQKLNAYSAFDTGLILCKTEKGYEIHGTSPVQKEANNIASAWQNYMGKAFKAVAPMMSPMFYQTWSTNQELTEHFTGKGREVSKERQAEYEKYSAKK